MNLRSTPKILYLLVMFFTVGLSAQSVDCQMVPDEGACDGGQYCVTIQLKSDDAASFIGNSSIRLSYDSEVVTFNGNATSGVTAGSYTSLNFDDDQLSLNDECASGFGITPYSSHGFDGLVPGDILITLVLLNQTIGAAVFACPSIDTDWEDVSVICFDVIDPDGNPNIQFEGTENGEVMDDAGTNFNPDTNDPTGKYLNGSFTGVDTPFSVLCGGVGPGCEATASPTIATDSDCTDGEISAANDGMAIVPEGFYLTYILTEGEDLIISTLTETGTFEVGEGSYTIHSAVLPDGFDEGSIEGAAAGDVVALLVQGGGEICASVDVAGAPIDCTPVVECEVVGGTIATADSTTICVNDTLDDIINVTVEGNEGENFAYIVTNEDASIFLGGPVTDGAVPFPAATPEGICLIWGVSWDGDITLPEAGDSLVVGSDCFDLSNSIAVTRIACEDPVECEVVGGTIATADSTTICVNDTLDDIINVTVEGNEGENFAYIVTNEDASIFLGGPVTDGAVTFPADTPEGICLIWGVSWDGDITLPEAGDSLVVGSDCFDLSNSIAVTRISCEDPVDCTAFAGGTVAVDADCSDGTLSAANDSTAVIPEGYILAYILTTGEDLIITALSFDGTFSVTDSNTYTIHSAVLPVDFDAPSVAGLPAGDVVATFIENGGETCASVDVAGAVFECEPAEFVCMAEAGELDEVPAEVCQDFFVSAQGISLEGPDAEYVNGFLLTGPLPDLTILAVSYDGNFSTDTLTTLDDNGDPIQFHVMAVSIFGEQLPVPADSAIGLSAGLIGTVVPCFDNDLSGAFTILGPDDPACSTVGCTAFAGGTIAVDDDCSDGTLSAANDSTAVIPEGYILAYILTTGEDLIITALSFDGTFSVTDSNTYTIHSAVLPVDFDAPSVAGLPAGDVVATFIENGGETCASVDVAGAVFECEPAEFVCMAEAGELDEVPAEVCQDFFVSAQGISLEGPDAEYVNGFLLTGPLPDLTILAVSYDGNFSTDTLTTLDANGDPIQFHVMAVSIFGEQLPVPADSAIGLSAGLIGTVVPCFDNDLSGAFTILGPDDPACETVGCTAIAGIIETGDSTTICVNDTLDDIINVTVEGAEGENFAYIVTAADSTTFLGGPFEDGEIPFPAETPEGVCLIWGVSWDGDFVLPEPGTSLDDAELGECYAVSNPIAITRIDCGDPVDCTAFGGEIVTEDPTTICVSDTLDDIINVSVEGNTGDNYAYIITNEDASIFLGGPVTDGVITFPADVPPGVCLIWGVAWDGDIELPEAGDSLVVGSDCFDLSNAIEVTRLEGTEWFADADEDGFGDPNVSVIDCEQPEGFVDNGNDPDDTDPDNPGQPLCDANAGVLTGTFAGFNCAGGDIAYGAEGFNDTGDFVQAYVLTDVDFTILAITFDGGFGVLEAGTYLTHALNVIATDLDGVDPADLIGANAVDVVGTLSCFDLVTATENLVVLTPVQVIADDYQCNEDNGIYSLAFTFQGGLPAWADANGSDNPDDYFYTATGDINAAVTVGENFFLEYADNLSFSVSAVDNAGCAADTTGAPEAPCVKDAIELAQFFGVATQRGNELNWMTATEEKNAEFMVQRSVDGINFETIAKVAAVGNSNVAQEYDYTDLTFTSSDNYYRLQARDTEGKVEVVSDVILLMRDKTESFELISTAPIPATDVLNITFQSPLVQNMNVSVYGTNGQMIENQKVEALAGINQLQLKVEQYAAGAYFIKIDNGAEQLEFKFIKK